MTITREHYINRRNQLKRSVQSGLIVMLGNGEVPFNYSENTYDFRQDSNFLYFFGVDRPGVAAVIDIDNDRETLFGDDVDLGTIVWIGEQELTRDAADRYGVEYSTPYRQLSEVVGDALKAGRDIHFLPFYRSAGMIEMGVLLNLQPRDVNQYASVILTETVIKLRSVKDDAEIAEIADAVDIAREMHVAMMKMAMPGVTEQDIAGKLRGIAFSRGKALSFLPIITVNGQILHNLNYTNTLETGRMLLADAGAENNTHYTSDISRTAPVGGSFSSRQRDIYDVVLRANSESISQIRPGVMFRDIHLSCAMTIADGLKSLGLMKGDVSDAVTEGAHALFMPHGLGHMLGMDAHDMEGLGEDRVGYDNTVQRSTQFGLSALRLAKKLEEGFIVTIEPGVYFIPLLIEQWKQEEKWSRYINFDKVETYLDFGGVRIEDNIAVIRDGHLNLSRDIPKTVAEIETVMSEA